jgi:hypothetical protein
MFQYDYIITVFCNCVAHKLASLALTIFLAFVISCQSTEFIILQFSSIMIYLRSSTCTYKIAEEDNSVGQSFSKKILQLFQTKIFIHAHSTRHHHEAYPSNHLCLHCYIFGLVAQTSQLVFIWNENRFKKLRYLLELLVVNFDFKSVDTSLDCTVVRNWWPLKFSQTVVRFMFNAAPAA